MTLRKLARNSCVSQDILLSGCSEVMVISQSTKLAAAVALSICVLALHTRRQILAGGQSVT